MKRSLGSRKENPSMVDFGYNNNTIRNQKHFKPIANGNVVGSGMIALTEEPLPCRKPKKEWKFKTHQLLLLPKYNKTQVDSLFNVSLLFLFIFMSTLKNIRQVNWIFL